MKPGDRLVCILLKPIKVGQIFKDWPLHITIVPWFRVAMSSSQLVRELQAHYNGSLPATIVVGELAQFGYKQAKTVNLLDSIMLNRLEGQTRRLLHAKSAWVVDEADKTRRGYRAHITHQHSAAAPKEGDSVNADQVFIVEQRGGVKQVVGVVELGYETKA